jgi:hypothetical protein
MGTTINVISNLGGGGSIGVGYKVTCKPLRTIFADRRGAFRQSNDILMFLI